MRLALWTLLLIAVGGSTWAPTAAPHSPPPAQTLPGAPLLPHPGAALPPSQAEFAQGLTGTVITETESCAGCHEEAAAEWQSSAHAFASFNNPVYRVVVDRFREEVGKEASRFCGGCHDAALLVDGAMSGDVRPEDPRAHGGVTCRVCHGIASTRADGNGSYSLTADAIPIPREGDDESLRAHKARVALAPLRTAALCGSCHRSFLSPETGDAAHLVGQDELGAWQRSPFAGSAAARIDEPLDRADCRTCHMPLENATRGDAAAKQGKIRSHRFAGAHTWLAAMRGDSAELAAVQAQVRGAASIDVAAATGAQGTPTLPADGAPVVAGEPLLLDVVVRNERVGHRFPGGVLDAQDTWIELAVFDENGRKMAEAGGLEERSGDDPTAHKLHALLVDERGTPLLRRETHRFRSPVYDHTVAPRDAQVVRYRFDVPPGLDPRALPLRVTAVLRHRSRNLALARAVCVESATQRGRAFARETRRLTGSPLDACAVEPVSDVARTEVWIGAGSSGRTASERDGALPEWRRLFDHGLGLLAAQQEDVDRARPSLERALSAIPPGEAASRRRAMILHALARVAVREGRTDEALRRLDEAAALAPDEPAIWQARAQALSDVWRWDAAAGSLERAAALSPLDGGVWSRLAIARGSAGWPDAALDAAAHGLSLDPRNADLLRAQALALERLDAPAELVDAARDAFARWRAPDDAPAVKSACAARFAWCALERLPVHVHPMRAP